LLALLPLLVLPPFLSHSLALLLLLLLPILLLLLLRCCFASAAKVAGTATFAGAAVFATLFTGTVAVPLLLCRCCLHWLCSTPAATFA
jgi:hypothetical protein